MEETDQHYSWLTCPRCKHFEFRTDPESRSPGTCYLYKGTPVILEDGPNEGRDDCHLFVPRGKRAQNKRKRKLVEEIIKPMEEEV